MKIALLTALLLGSNLLRAETTAPVPLNFGPISYFEQNCARCHGPLGSNFGAKFAANLDNERLFVVVNQMAKGPGNAPLADLALEAEVAFHRALAKKEPFISWAGTASGKLVGEVTPDSQLVFVAAGSETSATLEDERWTVPLVTGADLSQAKLRATHNGKTTELLLGENSFSHRKP